MKIISPTEADGGGLPLDVSDEDMERVERETASLLREGLIQLIAQLQGRLASSQEALSLDKEQLANRDAQIAGPQRHMAKADERMQQAVTILEGTVSRAEIQSAISLLSPEGSSR